MKKLAILLMNLISFGFIVLSQQIPESATYLGQSRPGSTPELFAPTILGTSAYKAYIVTFSPDGSELFFDNKTWPSRVVKYMKYKNGKWASAVNATFSQNQSPGEPSFSPDGKRVYYYAFPNLSNTNNTDIYYSEKQDSVWSNPVSLGGAMKTSVWEFHPCVVKDTSIYFSNGNGEICKSQYKKGTYQKAVTLNYPLNYANISQVYADAYVAKDESYIIFHSDRTGGFGKFDLYISYMNVDGTWTNPKNLGAKINTSNDEGEGDITPDGKYMTFDRNASLYWVSSSFIDSLKHTNFIPYLNKSVTIKIQTDTIGRAFNFSIPENIFIDDDGNNTVTYSATLGNGSALPAWLSFDSAKRTFTGTPTTSGTFVIKITGTDAAKATVSTTFNIVVKNNTASASQFNEENIQVYPNPTSGRINISIGSLLGKSAVIEINNLEGKVILKTTIKSSTSIDVTRFPKGIYLLKINIDGEAIYKKICLE